MYFGENAKQVHSLLLEFINGYKNIHPEITSDMKTTNDLYKLSKLKKIIDTFIVNAESELHLFDLLFDNYNKKGGVDEFINYREILEEEKKRGFKNLSFIFEQTKKLHCK